MKYINKHYSLFNTCTFQFNTANGYMYNGSGKISLPAETTKLYASMEIDMKGNNSYPFQVYFSDGAYSTIKASTVQLYYNYNKSTLSLYTNDTNRITTPAPSGWHKVYLAIDTVAGTVDFYIDGDKAGTYDGYVKTGVKAINAKLLAAVNNNGSSYQLKFRNVIISDQFFPINETIIEVPTTVTANGFSHDSLYSTETENCTLTVKPDLSVLDGYKVTGCNVTMGTTVLGDTIKHIKCDMGSYSDTKEIPATGYGMYFDELPTNISNITMTSKK